MKEENAIFCPNPSLILKVKVFGHDEISATTDQGSSIHEIRSFIDKQYLESMSEGRELLRSAIGTSTCSALCGTHTISGETKVIGTLQTPLPISLHIQNGATYYPNLDGSINIAAQTDLKHYPAGWLEMELHNVHVVEDLPVPLHVSLRGAKLWYNHTGHGDALKPECFPERFRQHNFWNVGGDCISETANETT